VRSSARSAALRTPSTRKPEGWSGKRKLDAPNPGSGGVIVGAADGRRKAVVFLVDQFSAPYAIALRPLDRRSRLEERALSHRL